MYFRQLLLLPGAAALAVGCATNSVKSNLPDLDRSLTGMPVAQSYSDPGTDWAAYSTFTVVASEASLGRPSGLPNPVAEQQLLFVLRNLVEVRGYRYVNRAVDADLVFTLVGSHEYRKEFVPPATRNQLVFVPGQTYNSVVDWSGSGGYGNGSVTTTTPGRFEWQQKTVPGYAVGFYCPEIQTSAFDARTGKTVWTGLVTGVSRVPDIRLPAQLMLAVSVLTGVPPNTNVTSEQKRRAGIGALLIPSSNDGDVYWPAVVTLSDTREAGERAGLRKGDLVVAINGESTRNRPSSDLLRMLDRGGSRTLVIRRGDREVALSIPRE